METIIQIFQKRIGISIFERRYKEDRENIETENVNQDIN